MVIVNEYPAKSQLVCFTSNIKYPPRCFFDFMDMGTMISLDHFLCIRKSALLRTKIIDNIITTGPRIVIATNASDILQITHQVMFELPKYWQ